MATGMKWFWIALALIIVWLLWPFGFHSHIPAFRDGFHFYYPQAVWLEHCYSRGEYFPQWNPSEGLGSSVAGQPTWQLYYPLRVIWFIPVLDVAQRYAVFVAVHLLLAALGMMRLGKMLDLAVAARCVGSLAFVLSCPVLFQLYNLVYLCSATWVAWGLIPLVRIVASESPTGFGNRLKFYAVICCEIAVAGSLMTLAGDPHGAVNFAIVLIVGVLYRSWLGYSKQAQRLTSMAGQPIETRRSLGLVALAILLVGIAIYQTQAALPWYRQSSRANAAVQVNDSFHPAVDEILQDTTLIQKQRIFDFSLSPWNLPTVVWPTWAGHFQPQHSRWVLAIPSEGRMWIPSLYLGIIPALLALYALIGTGHRASMERFWAVICLMTTLLAMGNYSLVWLLRNIFEGLGASGLAEQLPTDAMGSLYGLLSNFVPGYGSFRYPAKWSIWIVAGLSILAACGLDKQIKHSFADDKFARCMLRVAAASTLIWLIVMTAFAIEPFRAEFSTWISGAADTMLGSPNSTASIRAIVQSLMQPALVLLSTVAMLKLASRSSKNSLQWSSWLIIVILGFDLCVAANNWVVSVDAPVAIDRQIDAASAHDLVWANAGRAELQMVAKQSSPEFRESLLLQEKILQGKLNHLFGYAALHASGSIEPQAIVVIKRWLQRTDDLTLNQPKLDRVLGALGVKQRLVQNELGQLVWKAIEGTRPLCEYLPDSDMPSEACNYKWIGSDRLEIEVDASRGGRLLVRQLNDGGWQVASTIQSTVQLVPGELFVACSLNAGQHKLTLRRNVQ